MRRLLRLATRLYPRRWRTRYADEFSALLDQMPPAPAAVVNVVWGGLRMQFEMKRSVFVASAVLGLAGLAIATVLARVTSRRVESSGTMAVHISGSVNSVGTEPRPGDASFSPHPAILSILNGVVEDPRLGDAVGRVDLRTTGFRDQTSLRRRQASVESLRGDLKIQFVSPNAFAISFASDDPGRAEFLTGQVMAMLAESPDFATGTSLQIIDPPGPPRPAVSSRRVTLAGLGGLGAGIGLGLAFGLVRGNRRAGNGV